VAQQNGGCSYFNKIKFVPEIYEKLRREKKIIIFQPFSVEYQVSFNKFFFS
jgi:hypothetical protein